MIAEFAAGATFVGEFLQSVALNDRRVLAILIIGEMAGGAVEIELADVRREDLGVALPVELFGDELLQRTANQGPFRCPQDEPLADGFVDVEKIELAAEFAVVALFRLFEPLKVIRRVRPCS